LKSQFAISSKAMVAIAVLTPLIDVLGVTALATRNQCSGLFCGEYELIRALGVAGIISSVVLGATLLLGARGGRLENRWATRVCLMVFVILVLQAVVFTLATLQHGSQIR
jgi:hypothetical protein